MGAAMRRSLEDVRGSLAGRSVLVTGHTGFKGAWLSAWLHRLGARVHGVALAPDEAQRELFEAVERIVPFASSTYADLASLDAATEAVASAQPDVVFHLAAQPLVKASYLQPVETFAANVMGTVHILEACRTAHQPIAVVCVTSDKSYENTNQLWPYRESDPLGGHDPYSASKGASEIVIASYRRSFFETDNTTRVASARAGNVIGPGDFSADRLVADFFKAVTDHTVMSVRNPRSTRPWQHVLESLSGYLVLASELVNDVPGAATAWNFGPDVEDIVEVGDFVRLLAHQCGDSAPEIELGSVEGPHEASLLALDTSRARHLLGWRPLLTLDGRAAWTAGGYLAFVGGSDLGDVVLEQIGAIEDLWTNGS